MRIVLNGVETNNKGAELMLYAILQEIENRFPNATVFLPDNNILQGHDYIKTKLDFRPLPHSRIYNFLQKIHFPGILRRIKLPSIWATDFRILSNIDYFIDASGYSLTDKWEIKEPTFNAWHHRLQKYAHQGTRIIFLPQAIGPAEKHWTKKLIGLISSYSSIIFPRDKQSFNYYVQAGGNPDKAFVTTDFTSLIDGEVPSKYKNLKGKVAIIPNIQMINQGATTLDSYLELMKNMVQIIRNSGYDCYLLNHENRVDEELCYRIKNKIGNIEVATGLNALEVKGLISTSYLCITSRFHGLASSLNSCVPCLATSWSHKYEELYRDYGLSSGIIDLKDEKTALEKIQKFLNPKNNESIRLHLNKMKEPLRESTKKMWNRVWNLQL